MNNLNNKSKYMLICNEIETCLEYGKTDFIIYPFGEVGSYVKTILNGRYAIKEKLIVDNGLAKYNRSVKKISELRAEDVGDNGVIFVSSEDKKILPIIVDSLPGFLNRNQVTFANHNIWEEVIDGHARKHDFFFRRCKIGRYTTGYRSLLTWHWLVESIGRYCNINCYARVAANHSLDMISINHTFVEKTQWDTIEDYQRKLEYCKKYGIHKLNGSGQGWDRETAKNSPIIIGNDVWVGQYVSILPGVSIGDGAVIAAGAVVTHDVPPYTVVAGVPAKPIKKRYSDENIEKLLRIRWWDWSEEKIKDNLELFYQPEKFIEAFSVSD